MADYIDRKEYVNRLNDEQIEYDEFYKGLGKAKVIADEMPSVDAVEVVRCKDCIFWQDEKIRMENGECRDYLPDEKPYVTIDKGINEGAHCTLHGFEDMSGSWFWAQANDFCSRGVKKNEGNY